MIKKKNARDIMNKLKKYKVGSRPFFYPMHKQPVFNKMGLFLEDKLKNSETIYEKGFYIPKIGRASCRERV